MKTRLIALVLVAVAMVGVAVSTFLVFHARMMPPREDYYITKFEFDSGDVRSYMCYAKDWARGVPMEERAFYASGYKCYMGGRAWN